MLVSINTNFCIFIVHRERLLHVLAFWPSSGIVHWKEQSSECTTRDDSQKVKTCSKYLTCSTHIHKGVLTEISGMLLCIYHA
jgi:hypothetical protein